MLTTRKQTGSPLEQMRRKRRVSIMRSADSSGPRRGLTRSEERTLRGMLVKEQDFIDSDAFYESDAEETIYSAGDDIRKPDVSWYHPLMDDLSPTKARSASAGDQVLLSGAQERVLFLKFNYARYRIRELQRAIWASRARA